MSVAGWKHLATLFFTCSLTIFIHTVVADDPIVSIIETNPVIDPVENKIVAETNQDVQLTCVVENKPLNSQVQWKGLIKRNGSTTVVPISTATRSYDSFKYMVDTPAPTSWRLRIQNIQVTDEGTYVCEVQTMVQTYASSSADMLIVEKPQIADLATSSDVTKSVGESLTLQCAASGRPTPLVKWTRMAGELMPSGGRELLEPSLTILLLQPQHAGIYKCSASNSAGYDSRDIQLTINYPPVLFSANPVVQQAVGYVKELVCDIKGYPTPSADDVTWTKQGASVLLGGHIYIRNIPGASSKITSILVFWGVRESDYGEYTCGAKNDKGSSSIKFVLQRSAVATEDRTNQIRAGASILAVNIATVVMVLSVCLLQRFG
ncbi:protein amalgam-like [Pomacea canaliculata]|uniref:protein amalgam-like n=1 Tax=Pomacea canaliculata TaxID=400727 RepID=UPI000D73D45F|nr:protein amalgam-like [Pomacea canaliculata]